MTGFQEVLDYIRANAESEFCKGTLFERVMKTYFEQDPLHRDRFEAVHFWKVWAAIRPDFDRPDFGIDLVAEERDGGFCAVQCKCFAPNTRISKEHLDGFISASPRELYTARIVVETGVKWGPNALCKIDGLKPECGALRFNYAQGTASTERLATSHPASGIGARGKPASRRRSLNCALRTSMTTKPKRPICGMT